MHRENQNFKFFFGENLNYIEAGNGYHEFEIESKKADSANFSIADNIRFFQKRTPLRFSRRPMIYFFRNGKRSKEYRGPVSAIERLVTPKDGDLSSYL